MSRPKGIRDADYEAKRRALLHSMAVRLMSRDVAKPSLRDLAAAANVTVPTLQHYFGGRSQVIDAILEEQLRLGVHGLAAQRTSDQPLSTSVRDYAHALVRALGAARDVRLGDLFAVSLAEGMIDPAISGSTLRHILDPTVQTLQARLSDHIARGEMIDTDTRSAALMLMSPLLLASLHQDQLGGAEQDPIALEKMADDISAAFVRAYATAGPAAAAALD